MKNKFFLIKILFALTICLMSPILLTGCQKTNGVDSDVAFLDIQNKLISNANFQNSETKNLKDINTAQQYGVSIDNIKEGVVYTSNNETSDRIILVKAKGGPATENIEKALANEVAGLLSAWESNSSEMKKLNNHVLKTKDDYVVLIISENSDTLENDFDNFFNS